MRTHPPKSSVQKIHPDLQSEVPATPASFSDLSLDETILRAVADAGFRTPTPIQAKSIPHVLQGRDLFGIAQTGTGKTAAFALPVIQKVLTGRRSQSQSTGSVKALVLVPTRELAIQVQADFDRCSTHAQVRTVVLFGGIPIEKQIAALSKNPDVIIATPGRLLELLQMRRVNLSHVDTVVLDEADQMLNIGFMPQVTKVLKFTPIKRQTLFFSATLSREIAEIAGRFLKDPVRVEVTPPSTSSTNVTQKLYRVERQSKLPLLKTMLDETNLSRVIVFTRTKHKANGVCRFLEENGISASAIHGNKSQTTRINTLKAFKEGNIRVLIATDIAARGIDISLVSHVVNFELPDSAEMYIHRIGRTGRASATGVAVSFCSSDELERLHAIEKLLKKKIDVVNDHPFVGEVPSKSIEPRRAPVGVMKRQKFSTVSKRR